eukprot:403330746
MSDNFQLLENIKPEDEDFEVKLELLFVEADTAMIKNKDFKRAEQIFAKIVELEDDNVSALNGLAYCKEHFNQPDEQFKYLQKAVEIDPEDYESNFNMGGYFLDHTNQHEKSLQYFLKASQNADDDQSKVKSLFNMAKTYEELQNHEEAVKVYNQVLVIDPKDHKTLVNVAIIHDKLGQGDLALQSLQKAIVIKGTDRRIHTNLGIMNRKFGNYEQSQTHLDSAIQILIDKQKNKKMDLLYINRLLAAKQGGQENLDLYFQEAFQHVSSNSKSKYNRQLAQICEESGHTEMAQKLYDLEENRQDRVHTELSQGLDEFKQNVLQRKGTKVVDQMSQRQFQKSIMEDDDEDQGVVKKTKTQLMKKNTFNKGFGQNLKTRSIINEEEDEDETNNDDNQVIPEDEEDQEEDDDGLNTDEDLDEGKHDIQVVESRVDDVEAKLSDNNDEDDSQKHLDDKQYLVIDTDSKQVQLFRDESPTDIKRTKTMSQKKESNSSVRYSNADKSLQEIEQDQESVEDLKVKDEADEQVKQQKFLAVQVHSPSEDDGANQILESYQINTQRGTENFESLMTAQVEAPDNILQESPSHHILNLQFTSERDGKEYEEQECDSWTPRTCQYKIQVNAQDYEAKYKLAMIYLDAGIKWVQVQGQKYRNYKDESETRLFESIFQKAKCFELMKNYKQAILTYTQCTTLAVKQSKLYLRIAQCQKRLKNFEKCAENLELAVSIEEQEESTQFDPKYYIDHCLNLAVILFKNLSNYQKAQVFAQKVLQKSPENGSALILIGLVHEKAEENDQAIEYLKMASQQPGHGLESFFRLGKLYEKVNNKKSAITYYKYALQIQSTHLESLSALANILLSREEYDRAMKYFRHALSLVEDDVELLYGFSLSVYKSYVKFKDSKDKSPKLLQQKQTELSQAVKCLRKIKQINPQYAAALRLMGEIYMREKKYERAVEHLKAALQISKVDSPTLVLLGNIIYENGNPGIALRYYKEALNYNPKEIRALICIGNAKYDKEKYNVAAKYYLKAIAIDDSLPDVHYDLANSYFNTQKVEDAIVHYKKAILLSPHRVEYFYNLGNALSMQEKYEEAIEQYQKAIDLSPEKSSLALFNKGNSHYFLGQFELAIDSYQKAIELDSEKADYHFNLANSYQEIKDFEKAIHHYKMVVRLDGNQEEAYINLGHIYNEYLNDKERAAKIYKKILKVFPDNEQALIELKKMKRKQQQNSHRQKQ